MDKLRNKKTIKINKPNNKVLDSLKSKSHIRKYKGININKNTLINSLKDLLEKGTDKHNKNDNFSVENNSYKLEVNKRPIYTNMNYYKKGSDGTINELFGIAIYKIFSQEDDEIKIIENTKFFDETGFSKQAIQSELNGNIEKIYTHNDRDYTFDDAWDKLSDISVNNQDEIEEDFLGFEVGTSKFDIWHWVEEKYDIYLGDYNYVS